MKRNYTTTNLFYGNTKNNEYSNSICNTSYLNEPLDYYSLDKIEFNDVNLNNDTNIFFKTMDSFYNQKKELEDFENETDCVINKMHRFYDNKSINFTNEYKKKKKEYIDDYSNSIGKYNICSFIYKKKKIKQMNDNLNYAYQNFLERIEDQRWNTIYNYRAQRNSQFRQLKEKQNNFWKNKNIKMLGGG